MFILNNESTYHTRILYNQGKYEVVNEDEVSGKIS